MDPISASMVAGSWAFAQIGGMETLKGVGQNIVANMLDRWMCKKYPLVQHLFNGSRQELRNHDLAKAIRRAQLLALMLCVEAYKSLPRDKEFGYSVEDIVAPLIEWLRKELRELSSKGIPEFDLSFLSSAQRQAWEERWNSVNAEIHRAFLDPAPHDGSAFERQEKLRHLAESWVLDEASAHVPDANKKDWPRFKQLVAPVTLPSKRKFFGWWRLFQTLVADEVKNDPKVRDILAAQKVAEVLELQVDIREAVNALQSELKEVIAQMESALTDIREAARGLDDLADRLDAALDHLSTLFAQLLETQLRLESKLDDHHRHLWHSSVRDVGIRGV